MLLQPSLAIAECKRGIEGKCLLSTRLSASLCRQFQADTLLIKPAACMPDNDALPASNRLKSGEE